MIACITGCFYRKTQKYDHLDLKEIKPFIPPIDSGKVIKVYDGDTITIVSDIPGLKDSPFYKFSIRLNGIDTPEIRGKTEDEKLIAIKARDDLSNLILGDIVYLKNKKTEKYGRILCDIYKYNLHINNYMIEKRYALPYDGKAKTNPRSWTNYFEKGEI
jgi:micrococcal nuclease